MKRERIGAQGGFTLVELIIAMLVTLIVSGAIFGLLSGGNTAFRREPELSDRQQNIRVAMDLIQKDIGTAGMEMADFVQAFTQGDGPSGAPAPPLNGLGPMGPNGVNSDFLQIFGNTGECPSAKAEPNSTGVVVRMMELFPNCYKLPALVMLVGAPGADPPYSVGFACPRGGGPGGGNCGAEACANFPPGQAPNYNLPGGAQIPDPLDTMLPVQVVRYEIRVDTDGTPNLWRSPAGNAVAMSGGNACGAGGTTMDDPWQLVAKGIEDLQVRYTMADGTVSDIPAQVLDGNYGTLVKEVRVTLSARSEAANLLGSRNGTNAADPKVRGSMVSVTSPRAALFVLSKAPTPEWR
jgi:prepilin-type N-terminal cleavage/methylation domain-containing protein